MNKQRLLRAIAAGAAIATSAWLFVGFSTHVRPLALWGAPGGLALGCLIRSTFSLKRSRWDWDGPLMFSAVAVFLAYEARAHVAGRLLLVLGGMTFVLVLIGRRFDRREISPVTN